MTWGLQVNESHSLMNFMVASFFVVVFFKCVILEF